MSVHDIVVSPGGARFAGRKFACTIGRGGVTTDKREGDMATPVGTHRILGMFYRPDRLRGARLPRWAQPIGLRDLWSDDVADPDYNHLVRAPHPFSHETMRRADPLYDLVLMTDWNWPDAVQGRGSAIFLHRWRRVGYPTAGCVAFAPADLLWIAARLRLGARLVVAPSIGPRPRQP
ncbi:L,D-transpeptidase family protein [Pseudorhodobacter sp.]|jgi:L,D-peptidoglycan transpeptidase YkuD (ErfK/YbiS/YcfS/YnhG family)|uniref:L,D-transpeptidase family protein n=1 Tax=Pseudorhodobacter sp. TaxID=1934400 RepID=UPI002AFFEA06|nr:L,D-transpeptidase family protein [Pseudorhodobacter sp.]